MVAGMKKAVLVYAFPTPVHMAVYSAIAVCGLVQLMERYVVVRDLVTNARMDSV